MKKSELKAIIRECLQEELAAGRLTENNMRNYEEPEGKPQLPVDPNAKYYVTEFVGGTTGTLVVAKGLTATEANRIVKRGRGYTSYKHNPKSGYSWEPKDDTKWASVDVKRFI